MRPSGLSLAAWGISPLPSCIVLLLALSIFTGRYADSIAAGIVLVPVGYLYTICAALIISGIGAKLRLSHWALFALSTLIGAILVPVLFVAAMVFVVGDQFTGFGLFGSLIAAGLGAAYGALVIFFAIAVSRIT